jgi:V/A-type H+-transporting ATPase subunit E
MALDNIRQAVLETARKEADRILEAARKNAQAKLAAGEEAARQDAARRYQAEARAIDEDNARRLIQYRGGANKRLLELRNARLREVFDDARRQILAWPRDEYAAAMRALLERATADAAGDVRVHPDDRPLFAELIEDLNRGRTDLQQLRLDATNPLPERGGFVFVGIDFEVDQTLGTLLADLEHELSPAIAAELFKQ